MNRKEDLQRGDAGMALVAATIFLAVVVVTVIAVSARHVQQRRLADAHQNYNKTFDALEGAVAASKAQLEGPAGTGTMGLDGWKPVYNARKELVLPDFNAPDSHPISLPADPGTTGYAPPQILAFSVNWGKDGLDNNGDGVIDDAREKAIRSIHAAAKFNGISRRAEVVYTAEKVNVWQNAIFAGDGSTSGVIKGNVSVHGSVHILGDNLLQGGVAIEDALDLTGTSIIRNNYEDLPQYLRDRVPPLPTVDVNGTMAETLNAKLRVRHGLVGMSGNSRIGQPYSSGSTVKQMMNGTYLTDGWSGKKTTPDGGRGIPTDVYSDNGWNALYDLGDKVPFPKLSDPWRDPDTGATFKRLFSATPYTHEEYFSEVLLGSFINPNDGIYNGNIDLNLSSGTAFYWNANTNTKLTGSAALSATPDGQDDYIKFDPAAKTLKMNGQLRINGTLSFSGGGNADTINYSGHCAILTTGDVNIDVSLISCNNGVPGNYAASFPVNNCLGLMTKANMNLGTGSGASQLDVMGAFYAANTITSAKQTNVMGSFVSSLFNITKNVPNIYQVPDMADNLPLGMIGNYTITALLQVSWREMGLT